LRLLEDIRQYGRAWLRHEAEVFFGRYGITGEASSGDAIHILSPLERWFDRMRQFTRELNVAGSEALLGRTLDAQEAEHADRIADVQDGYFDNFQRELIANPPRELAEPTNQVPGSVPGKTPMSPAQVGARAAQYANAAWQGAQRIQRTSTQRNGNTRWERRVLGHPKTEHCLDCPPLAGRGWVPVGTLPAIGDTECGGSCLCHFEYSDEAAIPTGKAPAPSETVPINTDDDVKLIAQKLYDQLKQGMKLKVVIGVGRPNG
jgi:hypothetical protein